MNTKRATVVPVRRKPQGAIVDLLKDFLAKAEAGELSGVAIVGLYAATEENGTRIAWHHAANEYLRLLGAVEDAKFDLLMSGRRFVPVP